MKRIKKHIQNWKDKHGFLYFFITVILNFLQFCGLLIIILSSTLLLPLSLSFIKEGKYIPSVFLLLITIIGILLNYKSITYFLSLLDFDNNDDNKKSNLSLRIILFIISLLILKFSTSLITYDPKTEEYSLISSQEIFSLEAKDSITGGFVLGCGTFENKNYYRFYTKDDGLYSLTTIDADKSKLKFNDTNEKKIEKFKITTLQKVILFGEEITSKDEKKDILTIIDIPATAVKENFSI